MNTRRARLRISGMVLVVFLMVTVFVVRLVDIQVVRADELNAQSLEKRAQELITYGVRGEIVDAHGAVLADSVERYDITVSPRASLARENAMGVIADGLARIAAVTKQDPDDLMAVILADPASDFEYLTQGVTLDTFRAVDALEIPWVYFELRNGRSYPNGEVAGNLVGFIGTDGPQAGLEYTEDACLASTDGVSIFEKGEDGVRIPGSEVTTREPTNGGTLRLTIDRDLQWWVQQRMEQAAQQLGATWATAVVIRVSDGKLMAVTDYPTVDPNNVNDAPREALGSVAFTTPYEPGSTIKVLTAASLLDAGVVNQSSQILAPYSREFPGAGVISNAFYGPDQLTLAGALVESSNTAIAGFSELLAPEARHDYLAGFGFGEYTEVGFNGESSGTLYPASEWDRRTNYTVQFGQGMTATSVQMASAYQTLANGGVRMPVSLLEGCEWPDGTVTEAPLTEGTRVVSETAARQTVEMMEMVATSSGSAPNLQIPGYRVAVKSGTAEVAEAGGYADNKVVLSYAGMAPAEDPQYAVVVTAGVNDRVFSGRIASTFRDVMAQTLTTFRVPPSTTPSPNLPLTW